MALDFLHYDVFTDRALTGNQLAVFLDARALDPTLMQPIAKEMNFSESTFLLPPERSDTDIRMRIFTPGVELPMAGHPTIGSTFALAHTGRIPPGSSRFVFGLGIGPTPVDLEWEGERLRFAWMTQPPPTFGPEIADRAAIAAMVGLTAGDLAARLPLQEVSCGVHYLMIPVRSPELVDRAAGDVAAIRRATAAGLFDHGIFIFAAVPSDSGCDVYSRMFAPHIGVAEDPATGSASGPLGCYLLHHHVIDAAQAQHIVSSQGVAMGRPSRIHVAIDGTADAITTVKVGGQAVLVARGELLI